MSKENETRVVACPILTVATHPLALPAGLSLRTGGHFYPTDSPGFTSDAAAQPYVFIHVDKAGVTMEPLHVAAGTSLATVSVRLVRSVTIYATVHPMTYRCHPKSLNYTYYLPAGTHVAAGDSIAAWSYDFGAPAVTAKILTLDGNPGRLVDDLPLAADGLDHPERPYVEDGP